MASPTFHRLLLRAELRHGKERIVTHTVEISKSLVFVPTEEHAFIGDKVMVGFSFPGLVEPFSMETQVVARRMASGPGNPRGWTLGFVFYSASEKARVEGLLEQVRSAQEQPATFQYRVLLVEDSPLTRDAFAMAAQKLMGPTNAVSLDIAADGQDAFDRLRNHDYDLAIVDYFLPALNGDQLIGELRRQPELARLPIFAISVGGEEVRQKTLAAGADLFLQKPIVMRDLFHTLRQLVSVREHEPAAQR